MFFSSATPPFHLFVHLCTLSFDKGGVQLRWSPFSDPVVPVQSGACLAVSVELDDDHFLC